MLWRKQQSSTLPNGESIKNYYTWKETGKCEPQPGEKPISRNHPEMTKMIELADTDFKRFYTYAHIYKGKHEYNDERN